jgi:anti-anti-sigma factor
MSVFEVDEPRAPDPLAGCGQRHTPSFPPRLLCRVPDPADRTRSTLEVHVSSCPADEPDLSDAALLLVSGDLCAHEASRIHEAVHAYARFAGVVVLDLSRVRALDSAGVRLVDSLRVAQRLGGSFAVHDPSIIAERVLQICDLHERVTMCRPSR